MNTLVVFKFDVEIQERKGKLIAKENQVFQ